jgi:hypothetical protein
MWPAPDLTSVLLLAGDSDDDTAPPNGFDDILNEVFKRLGMKVKPVSQTKGPGTGRVSLLRVSRRSDSESGDWATGQYRQVPECTQHLARWP